MTTGRTSLLLAALAAVVAVWYVFRPVPPPPIGVGEGSIDYYARLDVYWPLPGRVDEVDMRHNETFKGLSRDRPAVLVNSPLHRVWPMAQQQQGQQTKMTWRTVGDVVARKRAQALVWTDDKPNGTYEGAWSLKQSPQELAQMRLNMTHKSFFYSDDTMDIVPASFRARILNTSSALKTSSFGLFLYASFLSVLMGDGMRDMIPEDINVVVHMASANLTVQLHCDPNEHYLYVASGALHVTLLPPSVHEDLFFYPFTHLSYGYSQLNLNSAAANKEDRAIVTDLMRKGAVHVVLTAGSLLYIPVHWHQYTVVVSSTPAVYVKLHTNFGSLYAHHSRLQGVSRVELPVDFKHTSGGRYAFQALLTECIVSLLLTDPETSWLPASQRPTSPEEKTAAARSYIITHYFSRYHRLHGGLQPTDQGLAEACNADKLNELRANNLPELLQLSTDLVRTFKKVPLVYL